MKLLQSIQEYISDLHKEYNIPKIFIYSSFLFTIIIVLDYFNYPTEWFKKYINISNHDLFNGVASAILITIVSTLLYFDVLGMINLSIINIIDLFLSMLSLSIAFTILYWDATKKFSIINWNISIVVLIFLLILMIYRIIRITLHQKNTYSIIDLKQLYECEIENKISGQTILQNIMDKKNEKILILEENDVDYDLLDRGSIIQAISHSILNVTSKSSFTLGIFGDWGSGKTTIINNVIKTLKESHRDEFIIIENFDPWKFGTQDAILTAMLDIIISASGVRHTSAQRKTLLATMKQIISKIPYIGSSLSEIGKEQSSFELYNKTYNNLKKLLSNSNKKILFVMDNIERDESEKIFFLFRMIGTLRDFPNIIYLLSYDKTRLDKIFDDYHKIDSKYLEKIINQEFHVPKISQSALISIFNSCLTKLLLIHSAAQTQLEVKIEYGVIIKLVVNTINDLRQFKRFVNSVFPIVFLNQAKLYKRDLFAMECIFFLETELYYSILSHAEFFTLDQLFSIGIDESIKKFRNVKESPEFKNYFQDLYSRYPLYREIIEEIFRTIGPYKIGPYFDLSYIDNNTSIYSDKYFDLYVSHSGVLLDASKEDQNITKLIEAVKLNRDHQDLKNWFINQLIHTKDIPHFITCFVGNTNKFEEEGVIYQICSTIKSLIISGNNQANNKNLVELLCLVIENVSKEKKEVIMEDLSFNMSLIVLFNELLTSSQENTLSIQAIKSVYLEICSSFITRGDNIFSDSYDNNIKFTHSFKQYVKNGKQEENKFKNYINMIINKDNISHVILAILDNDKQHISSELFNYFGLDVDRVQELLEKRGDYLSQQHHEKFDSSSLSQNKKYRELIYDFKKQIDSEKYLIAEET